LPNFQAQNRIIEVRQRLGTIADMMPAKLVRLYDITVAELLAEDA